MNIGIIIAAVLISLAIGAIIGIAYRKKVAESKIHSAEEEAKKIVNMAKVEAENLKKTKIIEAKEEIVNSRNELDQEIKERRGEVQRQETRLIQKEENLERRAENYEKKEENLNKREKELEEEQQKIENLRNQELKELQKIASLSREEAKHILLKEVEKDITAEKAAIIREANQKAKDDVKKNAKELLTYAVQKCAADHSQETTVSIVALPSDEMKGRIIGREGRNIKALETLTGVDLIIDDTPEAVVLSGFDPLRREVAKIALEKLIEDGRIHPAKIEEMVEKAKQEVEETIKEEGERAVLETGVIGLHPDIVKLLGKLKYRTSYGQNVLNHSIEVSNLARIMAEELGLDAKLARRAGLLHDIGKPFSFQEKDGIRHFNGHPKVSAIMSYNILKRIGFEEDYIQKICYYIKNHDNPISNKLIENNYNDAIFLYKIQKCDALAHHPEKLEKRKQYLKKIGSKLQI